MRFAGLLLVLLTVCLAQAGVAFEAAAASAEYKALNEKARSFYKRGKYKRSLELSLQALRLLEAEPNPDQDELAVHYFGLGYVYDKLNRLEEAVEAMERSIAIREKVYGPNHWGTGVALEQVAGYYKKLGRLDDAERLYARAKTIRAKGVGENHSFVADSFGNLASVAAARGNWSQALSGYRRMASLVTTKKANTFTPQSFYNDQIKRHRPAFHGISQAAWALGSGNPAKRKGFFSESFEASQWAWRTSAGAALAKMAVRLGAGDTPLGRAIRQVQDMAAKSDAMDKRMNKILAAQSKVQAKDDEYLRLNKEIQRKSIEIERQLGDEREKVMAMSRQILELSSRLSRAKGKERVRLSQQMQAMSRRMAAFSRRDTELRKPLIKLIMQLNARREQVDTRQSQQEYKRLGDQKAKLDLKISSLKQQVLKRFPDYAALADPAPLAARAVQGLLRADEALITFLIGEERSYVWAIGKRDSDWAQLDVGKAEIEQAVRRLRHGLDASNSPYSVGESGLPFDLSLAYNLYQNLLAPLQPILQDKRSLLVVPSGALTGLPFQVLVTEPPSVAKPDFNGYRQAAWLLRRHAITVLPSVPGLKALRKFARNGRARDPFIGFGDPVLEGSGGGGARGGKKGKGVKNYAAFFRGKLANVDEVRKLEPLPDTATELQFIAQNLGAGAKAVNLRAQATESTVKRTPLSRYQIVHFATHGLIAGDLSDLGEPALVLTPPREATPLDDGLLTASEVAALKMNADWVVLSACNTAAGDRPGAEALSGLARAFLFAGARSLLVSHWPVYSEAAVHITTGAFQEMRKSRKVGRAEALRRSMLKLIDKGAAYGAHPAYWAPFVLVGEGASAG